MDIDGHGAVVVGGANGFGETTARHLAELGADVTILDLDSDKAAQVAAEISGYSQHCDISEEESVAVGITSAMARFGQAPRIVVNCAGLYTTARVIGREGKVSTPNFRNHVEVNLLGTYHVMTYAAQAMMDLPPVGDGEQGVIINTTSIAYENAQIGQVPYAATTGAVISMCQPASREFSKLGVRVMTIVPNLFQKPLIEGLMSGEITGLSSNNPYPRSPEVRKEFARLTSHIVQNPYLNGSTIRFDGARRTAANS